MSKKKKSTPKVAKTGKPEDVIDVVAEEVPGDEGVEAMADSPPDVEVETVEVTAEDKTGETVDVAADSPAEDGIEHMHAAGLTGGWQNTADEEPPEEAIEEAGDEAAGGGRAGWIVAGALACAIGGAGGIIYASPWLAENLPESLAGYFQSAGADAGARLGAIEGALGTLETNVASIGKTLEQTASPHTPDLTARLTGLEGQISEQLAALEAAVARNAEAAQAVDITPVTARLDQIETALTAATESGGGSAAAIAAIAADVAALGSRLTVIEKNFTRLSQLTANLAAEGQKITALSDRLATLEADGGGKAAARAIALASLSSAVARGNFSAELQAFMAISPNEMATPVLDSLAAAGLPPIARLQADFRDSLQAAIKAEAAPGATASWSDKLFGSAMSVVTVRPVGEVAGDDTPAILARAEVRVQAGDIAAALTELDALSGPARDAMAGWTATAGARLAGLAELEALKQSSLAAISGATN